MIKLVRIHEQLYVADTPAVDVGEGREKFLCFITSAPSPAPDLDLEKVFGRSGSVAVVSAPLGSAWMRDRFFINEISGTPSCVFALVRFDRNITSRVDAMLVASASGTRWLSTDICRLGAEFGEVGATIPKGAKLSLQAGAKGLQIDAPADLAIDLDQCFRMYGEAQPTTQQLLVSFAPIDPGRVEFQLEIVVSIYNKDEPMLGLQYFRAFKQQFGNAFKFNRLCYPLFSLPPGGGGTSVRLAVSLDLMEPSPGDIPRAMFRSNVTVQKFVSNSVPLAEVPLNNFAPGGARLFATASSIKSNLSFHFATAPTAMATITSQPTYKGVVLVPQGSLDLTSSSGAVLGGSLLERVSSFERLRFNLKDPANALDAWVWSPNGPIGKTLDTTGQPEAYLSNYAITSAVAYEASSATPLIKFSPDRLALYSLDSNTGTSAYRAIECGVPAYLPVAPIDFGEQAGSNVEREKFDATVIARHRAAILGRAAIARASTRPVFAVGERAESSSTPQGFKVTDAGSFWSEVEFARGTGWRIALSFGSDGAVARELQQAFMEKEIFIVARRLPAVPAGTLRAPTFALEFIGSDWEFRTSIVGSAAVPAASTEDMTPLVIIKFGSRSVFELVNDTEKWTGAVTFVGTPADVAAVKNRLKAIVTDLMHDHDAEKTATDTDTFPGPFVNPELPKGKLFDPNWNGVVAVSLPMPTDKSPFPADLQPILDASHKKSPLHASIVCADVRPAGSESNEASQVLALVRYMNPASPDINKGTDPDCAGGFDLKLLKVRLRAALVEKFECRLSLGLDTFFGQDFAQSGVLVGAYDRRIESGIPIDVYSFSLEKALTKTWDKGSFLSSATLTRLGYERAEPIGDEPRGRFLINGRLAFDLDHVGVDGLEFDRLGIEFGAKNRSFSFNPGLLKVNVDQKKLSKLLGKLPFRLTSFVFGRLERDKYLSLGDLGFQPLPLFGGGPTGKGLFSYGFTFDLDLGSLGALSKKLEGFKAELLLGWQMVSGRLEMSLGIKLKGNKGGPLEFSLLDVIQVRAEQFGFGQLRNGEAYYIFAAGLKLRLLDQNFPAKGADQSIFVFYPSSGGTVAWLYARVDGTKDSVIPLFAMGQRVAIQKLLSSQTTLEGITKIKEVFKATLKPENLPYDGTSGVIYDAKADWLLGLEAKVFEVATLQVLVAEPVLYGARVTFSKEQFKFLKHDWFFDLLYRRLDEDTGIFSMEVPPPVDVLDFGAVQVILPTLRGEVGTPGNHLLADLGYPGTKSIAAWQRTGKIVAGIFGGDGGAYLGRVAPRTFPVQLTPEYAEAYQFKKDSCFMVGMAGSFGLMRYFAMGPMSGHASLTGYFMLEGALATIQTRPGAMADAVLDRPPSTYLMLDGQFGIKGCIEACADFKLIKVYFGLEFKLYFGFPYETWKGIAFNTGMILSAYARVVIARISIPFDGSFELALEFRFSFEAKFELRLSEEDPRWEKVFKSDAIVSRPTPLLPSSRPVPSQVRPTGGLQAAWTWPSPTLDKLGYTTKNPVEFWLVAMPTLADETAASGRRVPGVVGHLLAGEHPVYLNRPNSVLALADALLRWMLPQVKRLPQWNGATLIAPFDPDLLEAHMALQPENTDSRLERVEIPPELTGFDPDKLKPGNPDQFKPGVRLVSREANIAKARPGFKGLTAARLFELYRLCFDAQVALPKDAGDKEKTAPSCIPFPLPPLFELSFVVQKSADAGWTTLREEKRDLATHSLLSERDVDELQRQLDQFHALLKVDRELSTAEAASRPMQEWIFLSWHQLFCSELLRQVMDTLEGLGEATTFEALRAKMVSDPKGPAYIAAQGVSRLFAGGLRFTHGTPATSQGSFALAGTLFNAPELAPSERALLCLKEGVGVSLWSLNTAHVAACGKEGLPAATLGFDVTQLAHESEFVIPSFIPVQPKGYEDLPKEFHLCVSATLGNDPVHAFPRELVLALMSSEGLSIEWMARTHNTKNELEDLHPQPITPRPHTLLKLRGLAVAADQGSFEIGLLPLALEERELVHALASAPQASLRVGYRVAGGAPETPYAEIKVDDSKRLSAFRVDVSQEERPTLLLLGASLPYYAESLGELIPLLSAWARTGSRTCRLTVQMPSGGAGVAVGTEVEMLLLSDADAGAGKCGRLGNAVTGVIPIGANWFARTINLLRRMPSSPPEALLVEARRNSMNQALARVPTRLRALFSGDDWVPVGRLRDFKERMVFGTSPESADFQEDFNAFVLQAEAEASHFDLLALQVKIDGIEKIGFDTSLPLIPTTPESAQSQAYLDQLHVYRGFIPVKLLLGGKTSPYELVGKTVEVFGRLRDHYGQQAPHAPIQVLNRVEEYRDEIVGPNAWEHITAFLRSSQQGVSLVLRASVGACYLEGGRADFVRRRLRLIRNQIEDDNLEVTAQWSFGNKATTTVDKQAFVKKLLDALEKSLTDEPKAHFVELVTPLALPKLTQDWEVEPFAAVLRMTRPSVSSKTPDLVRESVAALYPDGLSVKGSTDSVQSLTDFFAPVLALFDARLAVCDPGFAHGSFFLVNPKCISGDVLKDDDGFHAILPFANKPVSIAKPDATMTIVDRDLDATMYAVCEALDGLLEEKKLGSVREAVHSLLSLKRQLGLTCSSRLVEVFSDSLKPSPESARRAVEDAVSQRASGCWRLASVADLTVKPLQAATTDAFLKIVGDFQGGGAPTPPGAPQQSLPVSTPGILCSSGWRIPVLAWMGTDAGLVSVPALKFVAKHILVDLSKLKSLAPAAGKVWLRLVEAGSAKAEFGLPAFTAPAPLRRVLETPVASGHIGLAKNLKPLTVAEAKLWDYSATYTVPGQGLQKGTDAVYVRVTSPGAANLLARGQSPEQRLLLAADAFIAAARPGTGGAINGAALSGVATNLRDALENFPARKNFGLLAATEIAKARVTHNGREWVSDNPAIRIKDAETGLSFTLVVEGLDACRHPCATTDLSATRNEQFAAGFGANPNRRSVFREFVYETPTVGFKGAAVVSIEVAGMLTGGTASDDPGKWLTDVIDEFLGNASVDQKEQLLLQCRLGFYPDSVYSLIGEGSEPAAVVMITSGGATARTDIPLGASKAAAAWMAEVGGSASLGFWCADVAVFRVATGTAPERIIALRRVRGRDPAKHGASDKPKKHSNAEWARKKAASQREK